MRHIFLQRKNISNFATQNISKPKGYIEFAKQIYRHTKCEKLIPKNRTEIPFYFLLRNIDTYIILHYNLIIDQREKIDKGRTLWNLNGKKSTE